jgi:hypothetical protein
MIVIPKLARHETCRADQHTALLSRATRTQGGTSVPSKATTAAVLVILDSAERQLVRGGFRENTDDAE